jgi:hypothetical protein
MLRITLLLLLGPAVLSGCNNPEAEQAKQQQEHQKLLEETVRAHLEKWTKDPLAMQIRNLAEIPQGICGEVNMKDDDERYQGFRHFLDRANYKGDESLNPSIANPESVFSPKGTGDVIKLCMTPAQRQAYQEKYDAAASAWKRPMQEEYDKAHIELLNQQLRAEELNQGEN